MYSVFLVNFGFTKSVHKTLDEAIKAARKTGYQCSIFKQSDPFTIVKWVSPV